MRKENIEFLEMNRDCYTEILNAETATKANKITEDLLRIVRTEFYPAYSYKGDCGDCLFTLVKTLYTTYDKWKVTQIINEEPLTVAASFPINEPPPVVYESIITKRAEKRKADSLKRHRR